MLNLKKAGVSGIEDHIKTKVSPETYRILWGQSTHGGKTLPIQLGPLFLSAASAQLGKSQAPNSKAGSSLV